MIASNKVYDILKGIGLNLYERKIWVSLLARGTSNVGELSQISKVPRSRSYDILQSLSDKGFVIIQNSKPIKYVAIEPIEALERAKKKMQENITQKTERIDDLKKSSSMKELKSIFNKGMKIISSEDMNGSIKGRHLHRQQIRTMIKSANSKINIIATQDEVKEMHNTHYETLKNAKDNGVDIKIATVSNSNNKKEINKLKEIANVRNLGTHANQIDGGFFVVDGKEIIMGLTNSKLVHDTQHVAFWSKSNHAAKNIFDPIFNTVWTGSKQI